MKKFLSSLLCLMLVLGSCSAALAESASQEEEDKFFWINLNWITKKHKSLKMFCGK